MSHNSAKQTKQIWTFGYYKLELGRPRMVWFPEGETGDCLTYLCDLNHKTLKPGGSYEVFVDDLYSLSDQKLFIDYKCTKKFRYACKRKSQRYFQMKADLQPKPQKPKSNQSANSDILF